MVNTKEVLYKKAFSSLVTTN